MIKGIVIYYSQTGNTKKVANAISAGVKEVIKDCTVLAMKQVSAEELAKYDLIGLGYPTWSSKEPPNVRAFIEGLTSMVGKNVFIFSTHGARPAGLITSIAPLMRQKGISLIGFKDWYGSVWLPHMPKPYVTDGHPDETDLKEAADFGKEMAELSVRIKSGESLLVPLLTEESDEKAHGKREDAPAEFRGARLEAKKSMRVDLEKCTFCNLCVENCPVDAIDFSVSPPMFKIDVCIPCWYCEQICPTGAIQVDWESLTRVYDRHNEDELSATLEKAEKDGRFRRLIPLKDIKWDRHWYQCSKHPRIEVP